MNPDIHQKLNQYLKNDATFRRVYDYTRQRFVAAKHLTGHNWEHVRRTVLNSIVIGEAEKADMSVVLSATTLHNIGFLYGSSTGEYTDLGAEKLESYLHEAGIKIDGKTLVEIGACIRTHEGSIHGSLPKTLEAKVVSDADLLEKFGPIGVYQNIRTYAEIHYDISRIIRNLSVAEGWALQTDTGRHLAEERKQFSTSFAKAFREAYQPYLTPESEEQT